MRLRTLESFAAASLLAIGSMAAAQQAAKPIPKAVTELLRRARNTEMWTPVPPVVTPGATVGAPPSDAIILFDGKSLNEWVSAQDGTPARWVVQDGAMIVSKAPGVGNIETKRKFKDYQLHLEWRIPADITGSGQARGNSGVFLASTGPGDAGYELP